MDVHKSDDGVFKVFYVFFVDDKSICDMFKECLIVVKIWFDKYLGYHVLFIFIEFKDEFDVVKIIDYLLFDSVILVVWFIECLLCLDDVWGFYFMLRKVLEEEGWFMLGDICNKVMFVMLDGGGYCDGYLKVFFNFENVVIFM